VAAVAAVVGVAVLGSGGSVRAQDAPQEIALAGTGAYEISSIANAWSTALYTSRQPVALSYIAKGDRDGRHQFASGTSDFAISGRPLSEADLAELADRKVGVIQAPIAIAAGVFLVAGPHPSSLRVATDDPNEPGSFTFSTYNGPLRLRNELLAKVMINRATGAGGNWFDPQFLADLGLPAGSQLAPVQVGLGPIARSDPGAANWYLERYLRRFVPTEWQDSLALAGAATDTQSESWPILNNPTRAGDVGVADVIGSWRNASGSGSPIGGTIGVVSPAAATAQMLLQVPKAAQHEADPSAAPPTPLWKVQMLNGAGDWVEPNALTISAAAAAGAANGSTALYGMEEAVPGAWPFWWRTDIFVPDRGLSVDKANAIASLIRYAATAGTKDAVAQGEGALPGPWATDALAAAEQVIAKNCTGSDRKVVSAADGGPAWPAGVAVPGGAVSVCQAVSTGGTTTTAGPGGGASVQGGGSTRSGAAGSSGSSSGAGRSGSSVLDTLGTYVGSSGDLSPLDDGSIAADDLAPASTGGGEAAAGAGADPDSLMTQSVAATLPLRDPSDGRGGVDRLTTMVLGGLAFLLIRRMAAARAGRAVG